MPFSVYAKNQMLDGTGWAALCDRVSVHTTSPASTGTNEATGGSPAYARQPVTWGTPSGGVVSASDAPAVDLPAGTYRYVGFWESSGSHYLGYSAISDTVFAGQGVLTISDIAVDLNATASA